MCVLICQGERERECVCTAWEREIAARTASEFALPVQHESCAGMGQPVIHCSRWRFPIPLYLPSPGCRAAHVVVQPGWRARRFNNGQPCSRARHARRSPDWPQSGSGTGPSFAHPQRPQRRKLAENSLGWHGPDTGSVLKVRLGWHRPDKGSMTSALKVRIA